MVEVGESIGIGIITCNRKEYLAKLIESLKDIKEISHLIVINDGDSDIILEGINVINNKTKLHVGGSKNVAMKYLLDKECEYIFTLEDDIIIKDKNTFREYINAHKITGIHHFNFGFSQRENLNFNLQPIYRKIVDYGKTKIVLTPNVLGALTFYTRECLQAIGLHHYKFNKGHGDHPELTYRAYKHGYTTPFWWFADIYGSWDMIKNQSDLSSDSIVRNQDHVMLNFSHACDIFKSLHGVSMTEVPDVPEVDVISILKTLKNNAKK